jgi:alkaline phosphatase
MAEYKKTHAGKAQFEDMIPLLKEYFGLEAAGEGQWALKDYELAELREAFIQSMAGVKINEGTADYLLYGEYDPLTINITHILNGKAGLAWTSYSHTGVPVLTSAIGVGAETFNGYYDNTDVAKKIMAVMGVLGEMKLAVNW